jgi:hypothetical protein
MSNNMDFIINQNENSVIDDDIIDFFITEAKEDYINNSKILLTKIYHFYNVEMYYKNTFLDKLELYLNLKKFCDLYNYYDDEQIQLFKRVINYIETL